ncbi:MAG TPA: copper transporter [Rhodospirillaceae bacterium]|nr:copper transporter [Rhodospirillaceae bacterium]
MDVPPDLLAFLAVLCRGLFLTTEAFVIGGTGFLLALADPCSDRLGPAGPAIIERCGRWLFAGSAALLAVAGGNVLLGILNVQTSLDLTFDQSVGAEFVSWSLLSMAGGLITLVSSGRRIFRAPLAMGILAILAGSIMTSHANARIEERTFFVIADALHQTGAGLWLGGIPFLLMALLEVSERAHRVLVGSRYSAIATAAVGGLAVGALMMSIGYTGSVAAAIGTAYGAMMGGKLMLLSVLLMFGLLNNLCIRAAGAGGDASMLRLRRFAEAEIGIGIAVLFAAATLATQPPSIDQMIDRATVATWTEIVERQTPRFPRLTSPPIEDISIPTDSSLAAEGTAADREWSEFNHNWAGLFVAFIGLLALADRSGKVPLARHWPLAFLLMAFMLFVRSDPESWPSGPIPFFERLRDPEVMQHRLVTLVVALFGLFEWAVRTDRLKAGWARYCFPLLCAVGGALLLTHNHTLTDIKQRFLIEMTHIPMGVLGILAAWFRWLEIRGDAKAARLCGWLWPACFIVIGVLLVLYREA